MENPVTILNGIYKGQKGEFITLTSVGSETWYKLRIYNNMYGTGQVMYEEIVVNPLDTDFPNYNSLITAKRKRSNSIIYSNTSKSNSNNSSRKSFSEGASSRKSFSDGSVASSRKSFSEGDSVEQTIRKFKSFNVNSKQPSIHETVRKWSNVYEYAKKTANKLNKPFITLLETAFQICHLDITDMTSINLHAETLDNLFVRSTFKNIDLQSNNSNLYRYYIIAYIFLFMNEIGKQIYIPFEGSPSKITPNDNPAYIHFVFGRANFIPSNGYSFLLNCIEHLLYEKGQTLITHTPVKQKSVSKSVLIKTRRFVKEAYSTIDVFVKKPYKYTKTDLLVIKPIISTPIKALMIEKIKGEIAMNKFSDHNQLRNDLIVNFDNIINSASKNIEFYKPYILEYNRLVKNDKFLNKTIDQAEVHKHALNHVKNKLIHDMSVTDVPDKQQIILDYLSIIDDPFERNNFVNKNKKYKSLLQPYLDEYYLKTAKKISELKQNTVIPDSVVHANNDVVLQEAINNLIVFRLTNIDNQKNNQRDQTTIDILNYIINNYTDIINNTIKPSNYSKYMELERRLYLKDFLKLQNDLKNNKYIQQKIAYRRFAGKNDVLLTGSVADRVKQINQKEKIKEELHLEIRNTRLRKNKERENMLSYKRRKFTS